MIPSTIKIRTDFDVELMQLIGSDEFICKAARVSTLGAASVDSSESLGLIRFLMKNRHGSPFEHGLFTWRISAPIFVWREFMRHRIGFSYNEQSGRYMELEPTFYIPPMTRNLVQVGKPGHYDFVPGDEHQYDVVYDSLFLSYQHAWDSYQSQLKAGVAKEIARVCLPLATYSTAYVTCNPRSLMSFLSLRTKHHMSAYPSFPQWEISEVARMMEFTFSIHYPIAYAAFNEFGRVSP